ncbi:hypothetical protein EOPP23_19600 [Endozoicomonas sp. OPT23]|uniref:LysR family transcriptional regulator n=1 Tax=Endozoicomonas sp. OPT23 TaxID=2072845 RepID=UPI00129A99B4|nr:LysR family transcriptional regulator [Endozoicomonas sp. OPT23]MRI35176.1 hypothetical protein [Endozoicomonas sp. OPT23]
MNAQMPIELESRDLLVIHAMVEAGTLEAAGRLLGRDVSSVFRSIKRIEKQQGIVLFNRSQNGYSALPVTRMLAQQGAHILEAIGIANQILRNNEQTLRGQLTITSTDLLVQYLLLPCSEVFSAEYPEVSLSFDTRNDEAQLWERNIDLALRPTNQPPNAMIGHYLAELQYAVVSAKHYKSSGDRQKWLIPGGAINRHWSRQWVENHKQKNDTCTAFDSMAALVNALQGGYGVGVVPRLDTVVRGMDIHDSYTVSDTTQLWLLYHPDNKGNPVLKAFIQSCQAYVQARLRNTCKAVT